VTSRKMHLDRNGAVRLAMILPVLVLTITSVLHADDVVTHGNKVMLATTVAGGTDPITSTGTAAIVQAAVFDFVNGIQRKYTPIHPDLRAPEDASIPAVLEVNDARVFAGIPYRTSCLDGNALGTEVARFVLRHPMRSIQE